MCQEVSDHLAAALPKLRPQQSQQLRAAGLLDKASSLICKASDTLEGQA
jgi:hypothetical protein